MTKPIEFKVGEDTLRGKVFVPNGAGPFPGVIFLHGSESKGAIHFEAAELLSKNGVIGFAFNYRGCGASDGNIADQAIEDGLEDAKKAIEVFFAQDSLDKSRIGMLGGSYGGFLASLICNSYDFKSIVLSAPAAYAPSEMGLKHGSPLSKNAFLESKSYEEIAIFKKDLLIIQCEFDDILPQGMVEEYTRVSSSNPHAKTFVLNGAPHRISTDPQAKKVFLDRIEEWFLKTL
ncbi:MAG: alpha/beta fold hydrolase [Candidatus Levybacteria bacterium]|nr:alpha/beta fold hydrolase [Candidatus Levybacteria bacterium]